MKILMIPHILDYLLHIGEGEEPEMEGRDVMCFSLGFLRLFELHNCSLYDP